MWTCEKICSYRLRKPESQSCDSDKEKAQAIPLQLQCMDSSARNWWLSRFRSHYVLIFWSGVGKAGNVSLEACKDWHSGRLWELLALCQPQDVCSVDETAPFKVLPDKPFHFKGEVCCRGGLSKGRVTVLLGTNMNESDKLVLLVIGRPGKPTTFKRTRTLPALCWQNLKAWMILQFLRSGYICWTGSSCAEVGKCYWPLTAGLPTLKLRAWMVLACSFCPQTWHVCCAAATWPVQNVKALYGKMLVKRFILCIENGSSYKMDLLRAVQLQKCGAAFYNHVWKDVEQSTTVSCCKHAGLCSQGDRAKVAVEEKLVASWYDGRYTDRLHRSWPGRSYLPPKYAWGHHCRDGGFTFDR